MRIAWIAGWASDITPWQNEIAQRYPTAEHLFLNYADLLPNPDTLWERNPALAQVDHIVAWSMGTLALLRSCPARPATQRWTLIAPIASFCAPGIGWRHRVVELTARQLQVDPATCLANFAIRMGTISDTTRQTWEHCALRHPPEALVQGLMYLANQNANIEQITTLLTPRNTLCIRGTNDTVVLPNQQQLFPSKVPYRLLNNAGHWLGDALDAISQ